MKPFVLVTESDSPEISKNQIYQTPQYLFDMGMCLCDRCGKLHSIDYRFCNDCFAEILIVVLPGNKPDDALIK